MSVRIDQGLQDGNRHRRLRPEETVKSDIDQLMDKRNLDAFIVMGDSAGNPIMQYLTGNVHLENALLVKSKGSDITLIHGSMERDNAARSGLNLVDRDHRYNTYNLVKKHEGDLLAAQCDYLLQVISDFKLEGRIGFYGQADMGATHVLLNALDDRLENSVVSGEFGDSIFAFARETKDETEMADLADLGRRTCEVVDEVKDFLQSHAVRDEALVQSDGSNLRIQEVRNFLQTRLQRQGLVEEHATIFAQGAESAVPHNAGSNDKILQLGQSIIFDIFPKGESGYFHDMTRTWCLGYAPDRIAEAWQHTKELFDEVMSNFKPGVPCRDLQEIACNHYERLNHKTLRTHPGTHEGYVHSLGHGIGLDVHEGPNLSLRAGNHTLLLPGHVITVEPGLYYPEPGFGVRIEDAVAIDAAGQLQFLTQYPYDLVVPMPRG